VIDVRVCVIAPVDLHQDRAEAVHLRGVFEEVARRRHSVIFIGTRAHVETGSLVHEYAVLVPKIRGIWWPMFSAAAVLYALVLDSRYKFDLIYLRDLVTPFFAELFLRMLVRRKIVLEVNGIFSEELIRGIRPWSRGLIGGLIRGLERHVLRNADLCICVCSWLMREIIKRGADPVKVALVPNGVSLEAFSPVIDGSEVVHNYGLEGRKIVIFVGSFTNQHNISLLIRSMRLIVETRRDVSLILVGDGPTMNNMQKLAGESGVTEDVLFAGRVPHKSIPKLLAASHVAVVPLTRSTTVGEMIPLKVLEYWAMQKPVVTTRAGVEGIPEARDGENVLFVEEDDRSMADGILRVLGDDRLAKKLGENGRKAVETKYNWHNIVDQTVAILQEKLSIRESRS